MPFDRRAFLASLAAGLAAPRVLRAAPARKKRYPIAFSTLGCPAWSWGTILDQADTLGYAAIELRGIAGEMDLPKVPELSGTRLAETRRQLEGRGLVVSDLGASAHMHEKDPAARAKQEDDGRRFIDLAHAMGVKYVRMFGNEVPKGETRVEVLPRVIEGFRKMATCAKAAGVVVLIESHGDFMNSRDLTEILTGVNDDSFALLWDAHHTFVAGHEAPADTYAKLGRWVRHTHLKDSRPAGDAAKPEDRRYVLTGTGEVPVDKQVAVLAKGGYEGYYCYEWEKKWHPEIEEPEVAFPHYAKTIAAYLDAAGVKPA
jgi:sugar phosphate isomerase/epimerase